MPAMTDGLRYKYRGLIVSVMPMSLRLPADVDDRLAALATLTGRSKTFYALEAIREHIDDLEDAHLSAEICKRIRAGVETTVPLQDLMAEYGLAG